MGNSNQKQTSRRDEIRQMKQSGMTYQQIADALGVSRQRAGQLVAMTPKERKAFRDEHGNKCDSCGGKRRLGIHHSDYTAKDKCSLLCEKCHRIEDKKLGRRDVSHKKAKQYKKLPSSNTSGYRGVVYHDKSGTWTARLSVLGTRKYAGYLKTSHEAALAYDEMAKKYKGKKAILNFT